LKGLALEIAFKWVILSAVGLVIIGMILFFSGNIRDFLKNLFQGNETNGAVVMESSSFSTSQIRTFIKACWDRYGSSRAGAICYALKGSVNNVDINSLVDALGSEGIVDITKFDNTKNTTVIKSAGKTILVES
jgi:hypothetical protein